MDGLSDAAAPPEGLLAEESLLGALLVSEAALADVAHMLRPEDFYLPSHADLYRVIVDMYGSSLPIDPVLVVSELTRRGLLSRVGGAARLHELVSLLPSASSATHYANVVAEWAVRRRLTQAATRIAALAGEGTGSVEDIVDRAQAEIFTATDQHHASDYVQVSDALLAALEEVEAIDKHRGGITGIPTGFADLDRRTNGLHGGQLVVFGARPAVGKSTLGVNAAVHAAVKCNIPSVVFSLEMSRNEIIQRVISSLGQVPLQKLRTGGLEETDWVRIRGAAAKLESAPLFIDDSASLTIAEIRSKSRRLRQRHGVRLIVVDYLQLLSSGRRVENRQLEVAEFSRALKLLAKELSGPAIDEGVAVIAISQLNRGPESRADRTPLMSDLRESGGVEADADVVVLIHREEVYNRMVRQGEADLILAKCRNGPTGVVTVAFQGHYSRFVDMMLPPTTPPASVPGSPF